VITGGASGIGAAATERFRAEGATVLVADLKSGPTADEFVRCDVTNSADVDELAEPGRDRRRGAVPGQRRLLLRNRCHAAGRRGLYGGMTGAKMIVEVECPRRAFGAVEKA